MVTSRCTFLFAASVALLTALAGTAKADSTLDRIAVELLAAQFGISTAEVTRAHTLSGLTMNELAPILSASSYGNATPDTIWQLRRQGLGWGQIAHRIGMHPGKFNKLRVAGAFDSGRIWSHSLSRRFGVPVGSIRTIQVLGASPQDSIAAILIGRRSNRSLQQVFDEYQRVRDWEPIRTKHNVDFDGWKKVAMKSSPRVKVSIANPGSKDKGHAMSNFSASWKGGCRVV